MPLRRWLRDHSAQLCSKQLKVNDVNLNESRNTPTAHAFKNQHVTQRQI